MGLAEDFRPTRLKDYLDATGMKGKNFSFITDYSREEVMNLMKAAEMLEPYSRSGVNLLSDKLLCAMFFQPSTRTRFSTETAMLRLGGKVISESDPMSSSSAAKGESLWDTMKVVTQYSDIVALRHPNDTTIFEDIQAAESPVISCGYGNVTHPTQGLLDLYTTYRALGGFDGIKVMISTPDLSRARSGQSYALGLALMGAEIVYSGTKELRTPDTIKEKLDASGATYEEHFDLTEAQNNELMAECDLVYLPGCSVPEGGEGREEFLQLMRNYYISLEALEDIKKKTGKIVGIMHSLPRNEGEFSFEIDKTAHELYFKQVAFSVPIRMALIAAMIGI